MKPPIAVDSPNPLKGSLFEQLKQLPPEWEWLANFTSPRTRRSYRNDIKDFIDFLGQGDSNAGWESITRGHVLAWREQLQAQGLAAATIQRKLAALASLFDYLCQAQVVTHNPVTGVQRPRAQRGGNTPRLTDAQARDLLNAPAEDTIKGLRDRAVLATLLYQGLRRDELCQLRVKDIIQDRGIVALRVLGKGGYFRDIPLHPETLSRIQTYLQQAGHGLDREGPLFRPVKNNRSGTLNKGLHPDSVYQVIVKYYAQRLGLDKEIAGLCPHALRATAATNALENGAELAEVQVWLGHADISTTRRHYDKRCFSMAASPSFKVKYD